MNDRFRPTSPAARTARTASRSAAYSAAAGDATARMAQMRRKRNQDSLINVLKIAGAVLVVAAVIALIVFGLKAHAARTNECKHNGGKVTSKTSTHTSYDNGKRHTDSDTTYYCVTTDRGIIDVWG